MKTCKQIGSILMVLVLMGALAACSQGGTKVDGDTAKQAAQTVYDGLSDKERGEIDEDLSKATVTAVTFNQSSGIMYDESVLNQEVYKISFPWKDSEKAKEDKDGYIVFAAKDDLRIVGYGAAK